jgi:hypothetical protein
LHPTNVIKESNKFTLKKFLQANFRTHFVKFDKNFSLSHSFLLCVPPPLLSNKKAIKTFSLDRALQMSFLALEAITRRFLFSTFISINFLLHETDEKRSKDDFLRELMIKKCKQESRKKAKKKL